MKGYLILVAFVFVIILFLSRGSWNQVNEKGEKVDSTFMVFLYILIGTLLISFFIYTCNEITPERNSPFNGPTKR
ncbi:MAG TPA: hypothetical protein VJA82_05510 [Sediminibacterium sp.]|uniref:hypothetical protein n=1 Tax=Sediminibacterium sp. TaxID=1917865 RepID=UPI0008C9C994|nr:hypothetical protein [Sediminibacterium sp.]OHC85625.1 MAG: hypothetical protein A2472_07685 [Sphingobacteriia bacterium RIFOXYC2_FULL_35_18]OHC89289.1 MAG: hypothetical protein A2546_07110 [Sphingobacteriia bacterium RIFOXYD2_FULL_35_12]HLD52736.1 hypothetical protein [Sediminibacterium sp.]